MVKNIRLEMIRNLEGMPTLAAMTEKSLSKLLALQQLVLRDETVMGNGSRGFLTENENYYWHTHIKKMEEEKRAELVSGGVQLNEEPYYKMVVPLLKDKDSFLYENK